MRGGGYSRHEYRRLDQSESRSAEQISSPVVRETTNPPSSAAAALSACPSMARSQANHFTHLHTQLVQRIRRQDTHHHRRSAGAKPGADGDAIGHADMQPARTGEPLGFQAA